jgi:acyl-ACP thioesterase
MTSIFEKHQKLSVYEFDIHNKLKVNALFNYIQDIAAEHAEMLNVGRKDLANYDLFWVLSWVKVKFLSYPQFGETIKIRTWPKRQHRLFSLRDLLFYNEKGEIFARVTTAWLLVNAKTMRATTIENLPIPIQYHASEEATTDVPEKMLDILDKKLVLTKKIAYSDIDVNLHTNNAKYVEFLLDAYPLEQFENQMVSEITLSFLSESKFGDVIELFSNFASTFETHSFEALNKNTGKSVYKAQIKWIQL